MYDQNMLILWLPAAFFKKWNIEQTLTLFYLLVLAHSCAYNILIIIESFAMVKTYLLHEMGQVTSTNVTIEVL